MSVLNLSGDESPECPLCMELLELDDINFYPCTCGYQICRFCWNKLRTEGNGLCPACRQAYSENPADFKPLTSEEIAKIKAEKRLKDQAKKLKISENRKHLANVRVVQKNLVFVVGLSPRLADPEILKKADYFGKFGKIHKVVINHSTQYAGSQIQGPSASAYVTYFKSDDALRAIQAVNNIFIDGRTLKASLGTTKYCSHFMKNQSCPKNDCMYLHELGDEAASFTKEEMQQGKHTDYEKQLHDEMIAGMSVVSNEDTEAQHTVEDRVVDAERDREVYGRIRTGFHGEQGWPDLENSACTASRFLGTSKEDDTSPKSISGLSSDEENRPTDSRRLEMNTHLDHLSKEVSNREVPQDSTHRNNQHLSRADSVLLDQEVSLIETCDFEEDDLGFDPFHETQKGLADLLESESKAAEAHRSRVGSNTDDWPSAASISRSRAPPPGFHIPVLPLPSSYNMGDPSVGRGNNIDTLFSRGLNQHCEKPRLLGHGFGFDQSDAVDPQFNQYSKPNLVQNHGRVLHDHQNSLTNPGEGFSNKDWQDGLRALLPNVNVSFGSNSSLPPQQFCLQRKFNNFGHDRVPQNSTDWRGVGGNALGNDWTTLDPAIVTGQMSNIEREFVPVEHGFGNTDSPPNWISANLEQLTNEPYHSGHTGLAPGLNSLSLDGRNTLIGSGQGLSGWGANTANPPPGFGLHRPSQLQQQYPGFGLNKNTEAQKIGGKYY